MLSVYESRMTARPRHCLPLPPAALAVRLVLLGVGLGVGLGGCAQIGDSMSSAFADPAKYDLYECKQLEPERKNLATRAADLQGLMAKADTGVAGPLVAELAYRNELIAVRSQTRLADEAWLRNKCRETPAAGAAAVPAAPAAPPTSVMGTPPPVRAGKVGY
jgi:hypothetical protein